MSPHFTGALGVDMPAFNGVHICRTI